MKKYALIVDLEEQYLTDYFYMMLDSLEKCESAVKELKKRYNQICEKVSELKKEGYIIHFTGSTEPYEHLLGLIDEIVPYWFDNTNLLSKRYKEDEEVILLGLFKERCVHAVHLLIDQSEMLDDFVINHSVIGDDNPKHLPLEFLFCGADKPTPLLYSKMSEKIERLSIPMRESFVFN